MTDWTFYVVTAGGPMRGSIRDAVPFANNWIVDRLNLSGALNSSIPYRDAKATRENLDTENTVVLAQRDDVIVFVGPLLNVGLSQGANNLSISCDGYWNYVRRRFIRSTAGMTHATLSGGRVRFKGVDQFDIVKDLIAHAEAISPFTWPVEVHFDELSGISRNISFEANKTKSIGAAIEELAMADNGFDWSMEPGSNNPHDFHLRLRLDYPLRGRDTTHRFELIGPKKGKTVIEPRILTVEGEPLTIEGQQLQHGFDDSVETVPPNDYSGSSNMLQPSLFESSRDMNTRFVALGPGETTAQLVSRVADPDLLEALPLVEGGNTWMDASNQSELNEYARAGLRINARTSAIPYLRVHPDYLPQYGAYITGDNVHLYMDDGWLQYDGRARITSIAISSNIDGAEYVDLEFADPARF